MRDCPVCGAAQAVDADNYCNAMAHMVTAEDFRRKEQAARFQANAAETPDPHDRLRASGA